MILIFKRYFVMENIDVKFVKFTICQQVKASVTSFIFNRQAMQTQKRAIFMQFYRLCFNLNTVHKVPLQINLAHQISVGHLYSNLYLFSSDLSVTLLSFSSGSEHCQQVYSQ